jgi:ADP-ribose pyrophosphatase YjhB (NUDIX family)
VTTDGPVDEALYAQIRGAVPIACVDALPVRTTPAGPEVGLILRDLPNGTRGWNLVGGGVYRGETLEEALARHLRDTLGQHVTWDAPAFGAPDAVGEYLPEPRAGYPCDPRKHAIALTYLVPLDGAPEPGGEAHAFRWFALDDLPDPDEIGFGQAVVLERLVGLVAAGSRA